MRERENERKRGNGEKQRRNVRERWKEKSNRVPFWGAAVLEQKGG